MLSNSSASLPYVCARCLVRQRRRLYSTDATAGASRGRPPPASGAAKLTNRRLISLHGVDTPKFMQGIITNNVRPESTNGFYAAFLTAQGRVLHDTFIYPTLGFKWHKAQAIANQEDPGYLIEVDADEAEVLLKHLKRHKLRSKFTMRLVEAGELDVWSVWKEGDRWTAHGQSQNNSDHDGAISLTDSRAPGMGQRLLLPSQAGFSATDVEEASLNAYTLRRYLKGVAEGQKEMPRDDCLPMNCNIDLMGGIDFKKGCYLGQELTIRTHHTGVVRRRVLPIVLYEHGPEPPGKLVYEPTQAFDASGFIGIDIKRNDRRKRSTGKVIAGLGNIGLGMCKLEQMTDLTISGEPSPYKAEDTFVVKNEEGKELVVKAFVPDWIRGSIREPKIQKRVE